jgi:hypothetical protein
MAKPWDEFQSTLSGTHTTTLCLPTEDEDVGDLVTDRSKGSMFGAHDDVVAILAADVAARGEWLAGRRALALYKPVRSKVPHSYSVVVRSLAVVVHVFQTNVERLGCQLDWRHAAWPTLTHPLYRSFVQWQVSCLHPLNLFPLWSHAPDSSTSWRSRAK